jgi:hypothetical protein
VDLTAANFFGLNGVVVGDTAFSQQSTVLNGWRLPDVVANLRVDQAWGYIGVSGAIHEAGGAYFLTPNNVNNGHPNDRLGWAVSAGGRFNITWGGGVSGLFGINGCFSEGAAGYCANIGAGIQDYDASTSVGTGWLSDGVFVTGSRIELTQVWSAVAYYQHIWSPKWRTSFYGGVVGVDYNSAATAFINGSPNNAVVCNGGVVSGANVFVVTALPGNNCNPDFGYAEIGTRTQWNPVPQLDIGLDLLYTRYNTAYKGAAIYGPNAPRPAVPLIDDQDVFSAFFRWQRNFFP